MLSNEIGYRPLPRGTPLTTDMKTKNANLNEQLEQSKILESVTSVTCYQEVCYTTSVYDLGGN